ncbi:SHOCT domain-containing protein [Virgibacillus oceani]|uniref:SHOCT domain-containing protein n=1 Tax=Virgibacillus oceani TaxID=1479511 RepID=A0A917M0S5_9BACI|nr:SHOCT domain-containing protein [Virgibacillus oceani]GGG71809.1 hypothetical protein GCM10011398_15160 [Virgibacillus oceani]
MYWEHFHPFGFFFFVLIAGLLIANIVIWRRRGGRYYYNGHNALSVLDTRLAKGEITIEEYEEIKDTLKEY